MAAESYDYYLRLLELPRSTSEQDIRTAITGELRLWATRMNAPTLESRREAERRVKILEAAEQVLLGPEGQIMRGPLGLVLTGGSQATAESESIALRSSTDIVHLRDVNSHSIGVVRHDESGRPYDHIVLKRHTPSGTVTEEIIATARDDTKSIRIMVTEREAEELSHVKIIGEQEMAFPPYPRGARFKVSFSYSPYSPDGLTCVEVFDITANRPLGEMKIQRFTNKTTEQVAESRSRTDNVRVE